MSGTISEQPCITTRDSKQLAQWRKRRDAGTSLIPIVDPNGRIVGFIKVYQESDHAKSAVCYRRESIHTEVF